MAYTKSCTFHLQNISKQDKCACAWDSAVDASFHIQQLWRILNNCVVTVLLEYLTDCSIKVSHFF